MSDNLAMLEPRELNRLLAIERAAKRAVRRFFTPGASAVIVMADLRRSLDVRSRQTPDENPQT